jgi:hypothetical protein
MNKEAKYWQDRAIEAEKALQDIVNVCKTETEMKKLACATLFSAGQKSTIRYIVESCNRK